jgi:hypothetical protein
MASCEGSSWSATYGACYPSPFTCTRLPPALPQTDNALDWPIGNGSAYAAPLTDGQALTAGCLAPYVGSYVNVCVLGEWREANATCPSP